MLEAYCDESQADLFGKPAVFFAAYLAQSARWQTFSVEWQQRVLDRFSIPYVHAVELRSRHRAIYRHLDIQARRALLSDACGIIASHVDAGFVTYMRPSDLLLHDTDDRSLVARPLRDNKSVLVSDR